MPTDIFKDMFGGSETRRRTVVSMRGLGSRGLVCLGLLGLVGCGGAPQVGRENRVLVESLWTAVSARNTQWLDENAQEIEARKAAGQLTETEERAFRVVIEAARSGDWKTAEDRAYALRQAQSATSEDEESVNRRDLPPSEETPAKPRMRQRGGPPQ